MEPTRYRITVRGRLTERLGSAFEGLALEPSPEQTVLVGEIRDQAHLYGILDRGSSLGLELVSVEEDTREHPHSTEASLLAQLVSDADHLSLSRLVVEIAWRINHGQADRVWELFVADGVLDTSGTPLIGHDAIRNWGHARAASTVQTRHICSGMRFTDRGRGRATGSTLLTVFMRDGDGRGPAIPAVVGEDTDEFVRTDAGWRFASRRFEALFA